MTDIVEWLREGASAGDPIRGPLYVASFLVLGLVHILGGGSF
ncbi:hypothetical protein R4172_16695 [Rhodococcus kroppenstedtii]|nr:MULTISPECIES: hypothetical protein [Rhodococcus]MDV7199187.1 hypothetical protein [Rhodococcus kroppenstedtii]